ncbi:MAG: PhnD/SsuA/transferrin family substrate-binding protein [Gammaproteobacteria bacterium]|jgi:ABC-type phosphate/phosphonate transport system substrate-binding protein
MLIKVNKRAKQKRLVFGARPGYLARMSSEKFIAFGMYTLSPELQRAWQRLFDRFKPLIEVDGELVFDSNETLLRDPGLLFGHTCGYPLMTRLRDALTPFCVPVFDVPGTEGRLYRSRFIVPALSPIETLQQCRGRIVAVNSRDSNSGMNVLRHALARVGARPGFFAEVLLSGSHLQSLEAVAGNRAQLAAIDCVSFKLIEDLYPGLVARVRVVGDSEPTCGLPLVMPIERYSPGLAADWIEALNRALGELPPEVPRALHLERFEAVDGGDYESILELENYAIEYGYAELN